MAVNILIADDDVRSVQLMGVLLKDAFAGVKVFTAKDGIECLVKIKEVNPVLLILDNRMPKIDGVEVCRQIKGNPATAGIKVLMVTAFSDIETAKQARQAGADRMLAKPVDSERFIEEAAGFIGQPAKKKEAPGAQDQARTAHVKVMAIESKSGSSGKMVRRCVERLGLSFVEAEDTEKACRALEQASADLVFMGIGKDLPATFRMCRFIRQRGAVPVLTGRALTGGDILQALRSGVTDVLVHPVGERALEEKIAQILIRTGKLLPGSGKSEVEAIDFRGAKTPPERARLVVEKAHDLLALPHTVVKMISLCNDPKSTAEDLEQYVQTDPAVTAIILRRANSAASGSTRAITRIRDGLVRIGMRETRNIALTLSVVKSFSSQQKSFGFNRYAYWIHSLGAAVTASALAEMTRAAKPEEAFVGGMLHDIGKIIFDDYLNRDYQEIIGKAASDHLRLFNAEKDVFEVDHASLGAKVGANWKLPEFVVQAIKDHHKPVADAPAEGAAEGGVKFAMSDLVGMSNSIAKAMSLGHSGDFFVDDFPDGHWAAIQEKCGDHAQFCPRVRNNLRTFLEMLNISSSSSDIPTPQPKEGPVVHIPRGGLSALLRIHFENRGYQTQTIGWDEVAKAPEDAWIACDARNAPETVRSAVVHGEAFGSRCAFVLMDDGQDIPGDRVHTVSPARDFFLLSTTVSKAEESDPR
jgi:putative nucleotidyltransferase with HDIG domain